MSAGHDRFAARSPADIEHLVLDHPLAWVTSGAGDQARATLLPIRPVVGTDGEITRLMGHFARNNPQLGGLRADPRASILFLGPHGYVSPSWMTDRTQAPTWAYASAHFLVEIALSEDAQSVVQHLDDLVTAMESGRPEAWRMKELGARYQGLSRGIVAFTARVIETRAKFKLGQDERHDVFADIVEALGRDGPADLREWMIRFEDRQGGA